MLGITCPFPIHMDFSGQKLAERLFQIILVIFGIIGFIIGYIMEQFSLTIFSVFFGVLVAGFVTLPPWPIYRKNPIEWQRPAETSNGNKNPSTVKSAKKDNQKPKVKKDQ